MGNKMRRYTDVRCRKSEVGDCDHTHRHTHRHAHKHAHTQRHTNKTKKKEERG